MQAKYKIRESIKITGMKDAVWVNVSKQETAEKFQKEIEKLGFTAYGWGTNHIGSNGQHAYIKVQVKGSYQYAEFNYWNVYKSKIRNKYNIENPLVFNSIMKYIKQILDESKVQSQAAVTP